MPEETVENVSTVSAIAVKTMWTLFNGLLLLKFPDEIQAKYITSRGLERPR